MRWTAIGSENLQLNNLGGSEDGEPAGLEEGAKDLKQTNSGGEPWFALSNEYDNDQWNLRIKW